jgi:threonine synthase
MSGLAGPGAAWTAPGIWRFASRYRPQLAPEAWLCLGEGGTPAIEIPALTARMGLERLVLKREDLNPTGSHKDRGLAFQVAALRAADPELAGLIISSSGNAALAAAAYAGLAGLKLFALVSPETPPAKLGRLVHLGARVMLSRQALGIAVDLAKQTGMPNLRPSTDPLAVEGFQSIAWELVDEIEPLPAVFSFASSATSFVAMGRAFASAAWQPAMHIVQGAGAQPIAGEFDPERDGISEQGRLGALGARKTRRLGEAKRIIKSSGGSGWVILDEEAELAAALLAAFGVETSLEGAASLAAAGRAARESGLRRAVVILTGRPPLAPEAVVGSVSTPRLAIVEDIGAALRLVEAWS